MHSLLFGVPRALHEATRFMNHAEMRRYLRDKRCLRHPRKFLVIAMQGGHYVPKCIDCWPSLPALETLPSPDGERLGEMVERQMAIPEMRFTSIAEATQTVQPMTIEEFEADIALFRRVVKEMREGIHYGRIPGTTDKSLWEPGAEFLRRANRLPWDREVIVEAEDFQTGDFRYRVVAWVPGPNGQIGARWEARAWSKERRFWCRTECPRPCDQQHSPAMSIADMANNVLDRAQKRAFVNLMRNVTAASGEFKDAGDESGNESALGEVRCPVHKADRFTWRKHWLNGQQTESYCHVIRSKKGPKGGYVFCEKADVQHLIDAQVSDVMDAREEQNKKTTSTLGAPSDAEEVAQDAEATQETGFARRLGAAVAVIQEEFGITLNEAAHAAGYRSWQEINDDARLTEVANAVSKLYPQEERGF